MVVSILDDIIGISEKHPRGAEGTQGNRVSVWSLSCMTFNMVLGSVNLDFFHL